MDVFDGAVAVAVHDGEGNRVWPEDDAADSPVAFPKPKLSGRRPEPGYREKLDERHFAFLFYVQDEQSGDLLYILTVVIESDDPVSLETAHDEVKPILAIIERQAAINAELASVRQVSSEDRDGLSLLVKMDELDGSAGPESVIQSVLKLTAKHFGSRIVAVSLPQLGIHKAYPASALEDKKAAKKLRATLKALTQAARKYKKVLLSEDEAGAVRGGKDGMPTKVLGSPIINYQDDVAGALVLIGNRTLPKDSVRLVRAICSKINSLTRSADQISSEHFSRHGLLHHMMRTMKRHPDTPHAFLYLDIDKLHVVNDSFGHMAGDQVIRRIIGIVDDLTGKSDAVSHLSGDRIGIFLRECDEAGALSKAGLVLQSIERDAIEYRGRTMSISASIGIALIPDVVRDAPAALNTAEVAARSAKDRGGGRAVVFRDLDASMMQRRSDLEQVSYLQSAFIDDRFALYAQRIQSLKEDKISNRFEILLRMVDENDQLVAPDKFLSSAERYQLMTVLDRWVIKKTLDTLGESDKALEINLASFSLNISAQSLADDDFIDYVSQSISKSGVSPDALCFEITETAVVRNLDRAQRFIRKLRKLGCRLALDDFGTGHCSFAYLKDMPVQYIKVDGVFIRDILENPLSDAIVAAMTNIASVMHAATVAEHVENDLVLQRLRHHDIDFVQGFAIDRPRPLADVIEDMEPALMIDSSSDVVKTLS
jgi:diguanylate cyclase (GGDEF)-like protein